MNEPLMKLDFIQTLAFAGVMLFIGYWLCRIIRPLARYNIPAPVVSGLLVALTVLIFRQFGITPFQFETTLREPLMICFFTTIGFGASFSLLKIGGPQVLIFFLISTLFAVLQNVLGVLVALPFGLHPLFGVLSGSVTLTGGPATGLAFAPLFEKAGVNGAATIAIAAAMFGIISGGLIGGPVGTFLIERNKLKKSPAKSKPSETVIAGNVVEDHLPEYTPSAPDGADQESYVLLKNIVAILVAMWAGYWVSRGFASLKFTLPAYIGAMFVAAAIRNFDDWTHWIKVSQKTIDDMGNVALSLFLVMALMTLKLWELSGLFFPLLVILIAQVAMIALVPCNN